jgi:hypothetical protein
LTANNILDFFLKKRDRVKKAKKYLRKQRGKSDVISTVLNELIIMVRELLIVIKISSSKLELQKCLL